MAALLLLAGILFTDDFSSLPPRDEIVLWDKDPVWIYTQDRPFTGKRVYAPVRNPDYNESNYRTVVSLPGWKQVN